MRIYRLLAIVMLLLNKERISAGELAGQFEVSPRTIYRDIEAICQAGIPVISFQGIDGGFSIMDNYKIDKNLFTPDEFLSILTALEGLNTSMDDKDIENITEKIKALFPDKDNNLKGKNKIIMDLNPWDDNEEIKARLDILRQAVNECRVLHINYINTCREFSEREIEPITLLLRGTTWYLYAFCNLRNDYRIFRLSRMISINLTDRYYKKEHKSFKKFEQENQWGNERENIKLEMHFKPEAFLRIQDFFTKKQIEEKDDGSYIVRVIYPEDDWLYGFLLSFGDSVEVLKPTHIRNIIKEIGKRIYEKYN